MKNGEIIFKKFPSTLNGVKLIKVDKIIYVNTKRTEQKRKKAGDGL
jgi:hypothetical protein